MSFWSFSYDYLIIQTITWISLLEYVKGYIGNKCEFTCPYPGSGESCQQNCNCKEQYCNHITGCEGIKQQQST